MNLRRLTPEDFPKLKPYTRNQRYGLCYYSLPSILTWNNRIYHSCGAVDGDALIVGTEYESRSEERYLLLPLSPSRSFTPGQLHELATSLGYDKYRYVSEEYLSEYGCERVGERFLIREQEAANDYIYRTQDLAELKGNKYSKKRNLINQFKREYVARGRVEIEPITSGFVDECAEYLYRQSEESGRDIEAEEDLICEKEAILNHIRHIEILEAPGILLRINSEVAAFGVSAPITSDIAALHFEKAYPKVKGLYQYFDNVCAQTLFGDFTYINRESDMGDPGLVRSKRSYHPVRTIRSYELRVRQ